MFFFKFKIEKESKELPRAEDPWHAVWFWSQRWSTTVNILFISTSECIWWEVFDLISASLTLSEKFLSKRFYKYCHLGFLALNALNWLFFLIHHLLTFWIGKRHVNLTGSREQAVIKMNLYSPIVAVTQHSSEANCHFSC